MFKSLKAKLKSWIKGTEKKAEKSEKKPEETKTKKQKTKVEKTKEKSEKKKKTKEKTQKKKQTKEEIEEELPVPLEFKVGTQKSEPDLEKLKEISEEIEEEKQEKSKKSFFSRIKTSLTYKLSEEDFNERFDELENILLENNVALEVVDKIKENLKESLVNKEIKKSEIETKIKSTLKQTIENIIQEPFDLIKKIKESKETFTILFFGINGSGKTTTIARLAYLLKKNNISCILAAADTFRAASIEQLQKHADNLKLELVKQHYGADPAAVAFDAIKHAKSKGIKVVLIDTAGRMHTADDLMRQMEKIVRVSNPDLKIFVAESTTGNDATNQAKNFNETAGIDAIILTKSDVDEKSGTLISVSYVTGKPIIYLGTGQEYGDLEPFKKDKIIKELEL